MERGSKHSDVISSYGVLSLLLLFRVGGGVMSEARSEAFTDDVRASKLLESRDVHLSRYLVILKTLVHFSLF